MFILTQLAEAQAKVAARDLQVKELACQAELQEAETAKHLALIQTLRSRLDDLNNQSGLLEGAHARGEYAIDALQKESKGQSDRILELEARIRELTAEREESEQRAGNLQRKFDEVFFQLRGSMKLESDSPEKLLDKVHNNLC